MPTNKYRMTPATYNITIYQGATFSAKFFIASKNTPDQPRDLTGYSVRMQVRKNEKATAYIVELSTENDRVLISEDNKVTLALSAIETAALPVGKFLYDLELINGSTVTKPLRGSVSVIAEVTR
jgi:hypothetical protein